MITNNLPFTGCDNCQQATVSQSQLNPNLLIQTCPSRGQRFWDEDFHREKCEGWSLRLRVQEESDEE